MCIRDSLKTRNGTAYLPAAGELRMLSQRLSKASSLGVQGNPTAFAQLKDSQQRFSELLVRLTKGGEVAGTNVPKSPSAVGPQLEELSQFWDCLLYTSHSGDLVAACGKGLCQLLRIVVGEHQGVLGQISRNTACLLYTSRCV